MTASSLKTHKGEFQEKEFGNWFPFGDIEDCPYTSLKNWIKEESWYDPSVKYSFIDVGDALYNPYRIAIVKKNVVYVFTGEEQWEKWKVKKMILY